MAEASGAIWKGEKQNHTVLTEKDGSKTIFTEQIQKLVDKKGAQRAAERNSVTNCTEMTAKGAKLDNSKYNEGLFDKFPLLLQGQLLCQSCS